LLKRGAEIKARDAFGNSVLHMVKPDSDDIAEMLIANGADLKVANKDGKTPMHIATTPGIPPTVYELLVANGADITLKDHNGKTPRDLQRH
jgi:ankyrin repeat protein